MEPTKVVSLRIPMDTYENILIECELKSITVTEWFERQIAIAKKAKKVKATLVEKLKGVCDYGIKFTKLVQSRLNRVICFAEEELYKLQYFQFMHNNGKTTHNGLTRHEKIFSYYFILQLNVSY